MAARCSLVRQQADAGPSPGYPILFAVSLLVSLIAFSIWLGWEAALIVLAVIFIHEMGHLVGMKICGYKDAKIFFVPMFGGVATGKKQQTTVTQELIVLLLGPLPGMLAALTALAVFFFSSQADMPEWVWEFCAIAFIINFLNLLPVMPLDGGRIMHALLLRRIPRIGFVFSTLSVIAMAAGAFFLGSWILGILAFFGAIRMPIEWFIGTLTNKLQRTIQHSDASELSSQAVTLKVVEAMETADIPQAVQPLPARIGVINRIVKALQSPTPAAHVTILGGIVYLASLILPLLLVIFVYANAPEPVPLDDEEIQQWQDMTEPAELDE